MGLLLPPVLRGNGGLFQFGGLKLLWLLLVAERLLLVGEFIRKGLGS